MAAQSNRDELGGGTVGGTACGCQKKVEGDSLEQHQQGTKA